MRTIDNTVRSAAVLLTQPRAIFRTEFVEKATNLTGRRQGAALIPPQGRFGGAKLRCAGLSSFR